MTDARRDPDGMHLYLLGGFRAYAGARLIGDHEWRLRKARALVKLLALAPRHRLHREQVLDLLWPDLDPAAAANNLHKTLHVARRAIEPGLTRTTPSRYIHVEDDLLVLRPPGTVWIDVEAFEAAVAEAQRTRDAAAFHSAIALYTGDLLPEDAYAEWATARRSALRATFLGLLTDLTRLHEERGEADAAIETLRRVVEADPAHEEAQASLMRWLAHTGRRHLALRQYQRLREALRRDLDVEPGPETRALNDAILAGRLPAVPALLKPPPTAGSAPPPLVGREAELRVLDEALARLSAGGEGLVLICGEAGVGKTRLAAEVAARARRRGAAVLSGAAYEQEERLPYGPFVEALDGYAAAAPPAAIRPLLGGGAPELLRLLPGAAATLGQAAAPSAPPDRTRLFAAVSGFLARLAQTTPVVLVLDDLHAADDASLQLLHYVARRARGVPLLVIGTLRPEGAAPGTPLGGLMASLHRARLVTRVDLARLSRSESDHLVSRLLGGRPAEQAVFEAVHELAAGNPFYIEEVVRALHDAGRLRQADGRWGLEAAGPALPAALAELMTARLARLGATGRRVLAAAAVIGRDAPYALLRDVAGLPDEALLEALDGCLARRVLEESPDGYRFSHPLYRAAVHEHLGRARRAVLHGAVAAALASRSADHLAEHAEDLAYHYAQSTEPGRAVPHLIAAAERAAALHATEAAAARYEDALRLLAAPGAPALPSPAVAGLWETLGDLRALLGREGDVAAYEQAAALVERARDPSGGGRLHRKMAFAHVSRHEAAAAEAHLRGAEAALRVHPDPAERARLRRVEAHHHWERGEHAQALEAAEESLDLAERHGEPADVDAAYETLALVFHSRGEWKRGLHFQLLHLGNALDLPRLEQTFDVHHCLAEYHLYGDTSYLAVEAFARQTLDLAAKIGARRAQAFAWGVLGTVLLLSGRLDEAEASLRQSLEMHQSLGARNGEALARQRLGEVALQRGDASEAAQRLRLALAVAAESTMASHLVIRVYAALARNELERGDVPAAGRHVEDGEAAAERFGACPTCSALFHPVAAETCARLGRTDEASGHLRQAQQVAAYWESGAWHAMAEAAAGAVAEAEGSRDAALGHYRAAAAAFERIGQPFEAARALVQAASVALRDSPSETAALLERAGSLAESIGAPALAARARSLLGATRKKSPGRAG